MLAQEELNKEYEYLSYIDWDNTKLEDIEKDHDGVICIRGFRFPYTEALILYFIGMKKNFREQYRELNIRYDKVCKLKDDYKYILENFNKIRDLNIWLSLDNPKKIIDEIIKKEKDLDLPCSVDFIDEKGECKIIRDCN